MKHLRDHFSCFLHRLKNWIDFAWHDADESFIVTSSAEWKEKLRFSSRCRHRHSLHATFTVAIFMAIHGKRRKISIRRRSFCAFYGAPAHMWSGLLFFATRISHRTYAFPFFHSLMLVLMTSRGFVVLLLIIHCRSISFLRTKCRPTNLHQPKFALVGSERKTRKKLHFFPATTQHY